MRSALLARASLRSHPPPNSPEGWWPGARRARRRRPRAGRTDQGAAGPASGSEPGGARTDRVGCGTKSQPGTSARAGRAMALHVALTWRAAGLLCRGQGAAARSFFAILCNCACCGAAGDVLGAVSAHCFNARLSRKAESSFKLACGCSTRDWKGGGARRNSDRYDRFVLVRKCKRRSTFEESNRHSIRKA